MKAIHKFELSIKEKQTLELPEGSMIIRVDDVDGKFFLWAIVEVPIDDKEIVTQTRHIEFYKTGQAIENETTLVYLGFCKLFIMQELGLYVFERINTSKER